MKILNICILLLISSLSFGQDNSKSPETIELYKGEIPNSKIEWKGGETFKGNPGLIRKVFMPTLEAYLPEPGKSTGAAVVICPGGGYSVIVFQGEGVTNARELAKLGVAAFVLKYRLPDDSLEIDRTIAPIQDVQQAIKIVRENCTKWGISPDKIGIMGFSAGGHLASIEATHYQKSLIPNSNNTSLRPDFQILVYPVISMKDSLTHLDSRKQLLGPNPTREMIDLYSNELQVDEQTPPAYITHAADDKTVDVDNSIGYFEALRHHKVPVEMHIYPKGGHGFTFGRPGWLNQVIQWMNERKLITQP
jgi:acetyl esterase/lipase